RRYDETVRRGRAPRRIPRSSHAFADRSWPVDMRAAAGADDDRLGSEHIEIAVADVEADSSGNTVGARAVHHEVRHHDPVVHLAGSLPRGFGDDRLVALAVNHDLPLAFS